MKRLAILSLLGCLLTISIASSEEIRPGGGVMAASAKETVTPASSGGGIPASGTTQSSTASSAGSIMKIAGVDLEKVGGVLVFFLVLSVLFESALTPIFNWRVFLRYLDGNGLKTPITIGLAFLVFNKYNLDILRDTFAAFGQAVDTTSAGKILSALLIAGGSSGILELLRNWDIREKAAKRQERVALMRNPSPTPKSQ